MSISPVPALRTVSFSDVESGVWAASWALGPDRPGFLAVGYPDEATPHMAELQGTGQQEDWHLLGQGVELVASPTSEAVPVTAEDEGTQGFDQLVNVRGHLMSAETSEYAEYIGHRSVRTLPPEELGSIRQASAWFAPTEGFALLAIRPRGAPGQESDLLTAAVLDAGSSASVADPRLSTTYGDDGWTTRVGLELWLGHEADVEEADGEQFPRRAAGESLRPGVRAAADGMQLQAQLVRWQSEGREGAGVYLLARAA